ncbi:MAG: 3'-5' exonuclease [Pikeienuella sp.]|uniref:3'-5' exonuclease n=1 Tax=Pikeienuella sp. TaxID=2831957 RepID=UPI00391BE421
MKFRIALTFTASLARLPGPAQRVAKAAAFDLQINPSRPGFSFHRVDRAKDPDFWTARVNDDIRIVVHKRGMDFLLCYVDRHDDAYRWAQRRRLDVHPRTGAAQLVEVRELVEEVSAPPPSAEPRPFAGFDDDALLACGAPEDWLADIRAATEESFLDLSAHLPQEAAEALLDLAYGLPPPAPEPTADPYSHPDALRRFRVMADEMELAAALDAPWEAWTIFLHPSQREFVERDFSGPARVTGSAGTGKTVVALHRAARLAREGRRVLLATFSDPLAAALEAKIDLVLRAAPDARARVATRSLTALARALHEERIGPFAIASVAEIAAALAAARAEEAARFTPAFLIDEWTHVVDAWGVRDFETYATVPRLGRKTRVGGAQREALWRVMERVRGRLAAEGLTTWAEAFARLAPLAAANPPFDAAVIDEAQDLSVAELRFLAAATGGGALFFAGDIGQRIFRQPFSWLSLGVDVRGRSRVLRVNYRTSQEIRERADRLLPTRLSDMDGDEESRQGVVSLLRGPPPEIAIVANEADERSAVGAWLRARVADGVSPGEIAVIVRSDAERPRAEAAKAEGGSPATLVLTMHEAKGLEFRAVAVVACDEAIVPLGPRLAEAATEAELKEIYETERHLLYVACTRARDSLLVSGVNPGSEFLADLR